MPLGASFAAAFQNFLAASRSYPAISMMAPPPFGGTRDQAIAVMLATIEYSMSISLFVLAVSLALDPGFHRLCVSLGLPRLDD